MSAGKFAGIIGKAAERISIDPVAKLTFEVSGGMMPMQLHRANAARLVDGLLQISLSPRAASCKPLDRAFAAQSKSQACCFSAASGAKCCG
jgi:hypothetical protein